jgi:hypothetical protein
MKLDRIAFSSQNLSIICELKQLESLELHGFASDSSDLNKLYHLEKLKRLEIGWSVCRNIIDHLKFGVFEELEELDARFEDASVNAVQDMKWITPNLKKIVIRYACSDTINALLETLENLEKVKIWCGNLETLSQNAHEKIKHLEVHPTSCPEFRAAQLTQQFPNLEFLKIDDVSFEVTESSFVTLLSGLKLLKTLEMYIKCESKIESDFILPCFEKYGSHLEKVRVRAVEDRDQFEEPHGVIGFTIDKKPNKGFRFDEVFDGTDDDFHLS